MTQYEQEFTDWALKGCPVPAPAELKRRIIVDIVNKSNFSLFVESGTYIGDTTDAVGLLQGVSVHTIELSDTLHSDAVRRFYDRPNIKCWHGDGSDIIPVILKELDGPAVFWLDGHFSAGITAMGKKTCPTLDELFYILIEDNPGHIILIDDMRCFLGGEYPKLELIKDIVLHYWPGYTVETNLDIMRIFPPGFNV